MTSSLILVALGVVTCGIGGWFYFERVRIARPPIGVFDLSDVFILFGLIVLVPILYLLLPNWLILTLLILAQFSLVYFVFERLTRSVIVWFVTILLISADLATGFALGTQSPLYLAINDVIMIISAVGVANAWAQGGMKARDAAILSGLLMGYDFLATIRLSLMNDLLLRLSALPLTPLLAWGQASTSASVGLGDLIMLTVFPLTMRKAFGIRAGLLALGIELVLMVVLIVSPLQRIFPVLVVLGPVIIVQYVGWSVVQLRAVQTGTV